MSVPAPTTPPSAEERRPAEPEQVAEPAKSADAPLKDAPAKVPVAPRAPAERPTGAPAAPTSTASVPPADLPPVATATKPASGDIDRLAVASAISAAGARASACRDSDTAPGPVSVSITFVPTGRTGQASVKGPLQGTPVGSCIVEALRASTVPPFEGEAVTVSTAINLR